MAKLRKLFAVAGFLGVVAMLSSGSQGQQAKKAGTGTTPQTSPAKQVSQLAEAVDSRFALPGVLTYEPLKGDLYFALQLQPKLEAVARRPRDILIIHSTAATQAGPSWIAAQQIATGIIDAAAESDHVSLWTANSPENTRSLSKDFLKPTDMAEGKRLREALKQFRAKEYPSGDTDLKHVLEQTIKTFDAGKDRQRIILFLGDGLSTHNPMTDADRLAIAKKMVDRKIAFFPVPLGSQLDPKTLHGLANSTGGFVLRTHVQTEQVADVLKRYEDAFAGSVLYSANLQLPPAMTDVCPATLPPLRSDSPTLVVGRVKKATKQFDVGVTGVVAGRKGDVTVNAAVPMQPADLDNYFLVALVDQWAKAKDAPAILRADRALANTYEQTRLQHLELLENAQLALQEDKLDAASRIYQQVRQLSPRDEEAQAGIRLIDRLKDGTLTKDKIRKQIENRQGQADQLKVVDGKPRWERINLIQLAQAEVKAAKEAQAAAAQPQLPELGPDHLLKEHRNRLAVEEQKISQSVEDAIRQANRNLRTDPDGTLDMLRNLLNRVKDHPDLGALTRDMLTTRLQTSLRDSASEVQRVKLIKKDQTQAAAQAQVNLIREQERKSFIDRVESQFRVYKSLMQVARIDEQKKYAILDSMVDIYTDARLKGHDVPVTAKAMYDIALAAYPLTQHNRLVRIREEKWLSVMFQIEKSHIPYPDEPSIHFPPLATWKALTKMRKDKYEVTSLPDDPEGRAEAKAIARLLDTPVKTDDFQEPRSLKWTLEYFSDKWKLPILVDKDAFAAELADADIYADEVKLPPIPRTMAMKTALRLILGQVGKGKATYVIRRNFVEITTVDTYLSDKVLSIIGVSDLVMPIGQSGFGSFGGVMPGMGVGMGMPGMGMGMPGMGMGMPGMGMGMPGMGMGMPGMGMGMPGMGMGMPGMGMGMPGMMMGGGGGAQGAAAQQAQGLIAIIQSLIGPEDWNTTVPLNNMMPGAMPGMIPGMFPGMMPGMFPGMMPGGMMMMMNPGMINDPLNPPKSSNALNSISYFAPSMALIVRAPTRMHSSIIGGTIGGPRKRADAAVRLEMAKNPDLFAKVELKKDPKIKVAPAQEIDPLTAQLLKKRKELDPTKVWDEAIAAGGVDAGAIIATADFLFEVGEFRNAAELLKANLRHGVIVRPWVYEALAVALETYGGDPEEIRRARLSGIALDPTDAQGFMSAARAMANRGQHDRAIAFCRQAALLEPNDYHPYQVALAYAETAKDAKAMEWAVGNLVAQDWPVDNHMIQAMAKQRLSSLAVTLKADKREGEADKLQAALARLNQRDLIIKLKWDNANGMAELEMKVKEPAGSVCNLEQKQSPGGGVMLGFNLTDKEPNCQYIAAQALSGDYEITVSRIYGQPLANRAWLEIVQNSGTPQQTRRLEIIRLDQKNTPIKLTLKDGRRTELATVSPNASKRGETAREEKTTNAFNDLRALANPGLYGGSGPRGGAGATNVMPSVLAARDSKTKPAMTPITQNAINPGKAGGVQMTTQVRMSTDQRSMDMVIRPFFNSVTAAARPAVNLSAIPGGAN